jgi:hypothetical protein
LELGGCKLSGVATASNFLEFEIEHWRKLDYQGLREQFEDDVEYPECISWNSKSWYP